MKNHALKESLKRKLLSSGQISDILSEGQNTSRNHFLQVQFEETDKIIGYIWMELKDRAEGKMAFLYDFFIQPDHRGMGFGKVALELLEAYAMMLKADRLALHVFRTNAAAIRLYEKSGYQKTTQGTNGFEMAKVFTS